MGNYKWTNCNSKVDAPCKVIFFVSRNKDNKDVEGFKERREAYYMHYDVDKILQMFKEFVERGVAGEFCRLYESVNARDDKKVHRELLKMLIDNEDVNLDYIMPKIAGLAAKKECAAESKWMFDFDDESFTQLTAFEQYIKKECPEIGIEQHRTPHGFAVIVDRGFDTRKLLEAFPQATLKRDDLFCAFWYTRVKEK